MNHISRNFATRCYCNPNKNHPVSISESAPENEKMRDKTSHIVHFLDQKCSERGLNYEFPISDNIYNSFDTSV